MAAKLSVASLRAELSVDARGGRKARSACRQCTPRANLELSPGTSRRLAPACAVPATAPPQRPSDPRDASAGSCFRPSRSGAAWRPCACEPGPAAARSTAAPARRGGADRSAAGGADWPCREQRAAALAAYRRGCRAARHGRRLGGAGGPGGAKGLLNFLSAHFIPNSSSCRLASWSIFGSLVNSRTLMKSLIALSLSPLNLKASPRV